MEEALRVRDDERRGEKPMKDAQSAGMDGPRQVKDDGAGEGPAGWHLSSEELTAIAAHVYGALCIWSGIIAPPGRIDEVDLGVDGALAGPLALVRDLNSHEIEAPLRRHAMETRPNHLPSHDALHGEAPVVEA